MSYDEFYKNGGFGHSYPSGVNFINQTSLPELIQKISGLTCIDIGCGDGFWSNILQQLGYKVTGIDLSEGGIEVARGKYPGCEFCAGDILDHDNHYDVSFVKNLSCFNRPLDELADKTMGHIVSMTGKLIFLAMHSKEPYRRWSSSRSSYYHHPKDLYDFVTDWVGEEGVTLNFFANNIIIEAYLS